VNATQVLAERAIATYQELLKQSVPRAASLGEPAPAGLTAAITDAPRHGR
jgi:hypothetical protein